MVDLKGKLMKSLGSERGNHPTMHNLNPPSETVKECEEEEGEAKPFYL